MTLFSDDAGAVKAGAAADISPFATGPRPHLSVETTNTSLPNLTSPLIHNQYHDGGGLSCRSPLPQQSTQPCAQITDSYHYSQGRPLVSSQSASSCILDVEDAQGKQTDSNSPSQVAVPLSNFPSLVTSQNRPDSPPAVEWERFAFLLQCIMHPKSVPLIIYTPSPNRVHCKDTSVLLTT